MEWIIGIVLAVIFVGVIIMAGESNKCPHCDEETVDVGYNGWKRKCMHCGWKNHD